MQIRIVATQINASSNKVLALLNSRMSVISLIWRDIVNRAFHSVYLLPSAVVSVVVWLPLLDSMGMNKRPVVFSAGWTSRL